MYIFILENIKVLLSNIFIVPARVDCREALVESRVADKQTNERTKNKQTNKQTNKTFSRHRLFRIPTTYIIIISFRSCKRNRIAHEPKVPFLYTIC